MAVSETTQHRPNLVRAWFDTVLNPIIWGLRSEVEALNNGDLSWRFSERRLVSLVPVKDQLIAGALDNYDQFVSLYPQCLPPIEKHDDLLRNLSERCGNLERVLVESQAMKEAFEHTAAKWSEGDLRSCFPAAPTDVPRKVLAEYIINNVQRLPGYFTTAPFWNENRIEFLKIRESDEIRQSWEDTIDAAGEFRRAAEDLLQLLTALRSELSFALDVPIVDRIGP